MPYQTHCSKLDGELRKRKLKSFLRHGSTNLMSKEMGIYLRQRRNLRILKKRFQHPFVLLKHCLSHRNSTQRHTTSLCFPCPFVCFPVLPKSGFPEHRMTFGRILGSGSMGWKIRPLSSSTEQKGFVHHFNCIEEDFTPVLLMLLHLTGFCSHKETILPFSMSFFLLSICHT